MNKTASLILSFIFFTVLLAGQAVTTDPAVPTMGKTIKILFDSSKDNNNRGLKNYQGDLYAHTGLTVNGSRWQNVIAAWGVNVAKCKFTYLGNYKYELLITPDIETFYALTAGLKATEICLVIRSADGTKQTDPDIFLPVFETGLNAVIVSPSKQFMVVGLNDQVSVSASSTLADSLSLYINNKFITSGSTPNSLAYNYVANEFGGTWIKAVAWDKPSSAADSFFVYVRGPVTVEALPAGLNDGINYTSETSATLVLHAPYKQFAFALGDFTGWLLSDKGYMKKTPDGERYWVELTGLKSGKEYRFQYLVDSTMIAEPYSDKLLDPFNDQYISSTTYPALIKYPKDTTTGIVSVLQTGQQPYQWKTGSFQAPAKEKLVIYELLVRDFVATHAFKTITDSLAYLKKLGVNAIELMPVTEFEGNLSWGYNPSFYFAPDKYYGPKNEFKRFIDSCHSRGIAVIMDMVLNHCFGQSPFVQLYLDSYGTDQIFMKLPNPWFNASSPNTAYKWGADFNHESPATQKLVDRVTSYWMTEYKIDGFRFDFTKGFTNTPGDGGAYDAARINILKRMADKMWEVNPDAYVILEHLTANSEEKVLAEYGMLLWGNMNYQYSEAVMGFPSDLTFATSKARDWGQPNLVTYMESHDEERIMYKALTFGNSGPSHNVKDIPVALRRVELAALFFLTIPGPKMIWQFGELGYDVSIDQNGRTGEKPLLWIYYQVPERFRLYTFFRILNELKRDQPVFSTADYTYSLNGKQKTLQLNSTDQKVNILGNFDVITGYVTPAFQQAGKWYEYFTDDSITVAGLNDPILLQPGEYRLYTTKRLKSPKKTLGTGDIKAGEINMTVYPNPSSSAFNFSIMTSRPEEINISIFDLSGRMLREIKTPVSVPGKEIITWDGRTAGGLFAAKGIYIARITTGGLTRTIRLIRN